MTLTSDEKAGWRPIDTAPRDGTIIMLCIVGAQPAIGCWFDPPAEAHQYEFRNAKCWLSFDPEGMFETAEELDDYMGGTRYEPTHWQPLPPPPEQIP